MKAVENLAGFSTCAFGTFGKNVVNGTVILSGNFLAQKIVVEESLTKK
ncbi:hypothetical protein [Lagierella massiliensis]|nr:hypothetical protein [Lagierella massiliensis]